MNYTVMVVDELFKDIGNMELDKYGQLVDQYLNRVR